MVKKVADNPDELVARSMVKENFELVAVTSVTTEDPTSLERRIGGVEAEVGRVFRGPDVYRFQSCMLRENCRAR